MSVCVGCSTCSAGNACIECGRGWRSREAESDPPIVERWAQAARHKWSARAHVRLCVLVGENAVRRRMVSGFTRREFLRELDRATDRGRDQCVPFLRTIGGTG